MSFLSLIVDKQKAAQYRGSDIAETISMLDNGRSQTCSSLILHIILLRSEFYDLTSMSTKKGM